MSDLRSSILGYCAKIGNDPLLVQGAGGNVSWKENGILWIKASGTRLPDATTKEIFVPVDLSDFQAAISQNHFATPPKLTSASELRPSIETPLHALMPQRVVVHLHAVEILARLVRKDCEKELNTALGDSVSWALIDYIKPGPDLAAEVNKVLMTHVGTNVLFLKNHGVVVGGEDISEVRETLARVIGALSLKARNASPLKTPVSLLKEYAPVGSQMVHQLATEEIFFQRLGTDWALYPDHVVFLGPQARTYPSWEDLKNASNHEYPELVFIQREGVFVTEAFSETKMEQLCCYYNILSRQSPDTVLDSLSWEQVASLINWDAEKYRIGLSKER